MAPPLPLEDVLSWGWDSIYRPQRQAYIGVAIEYPVLRIFGSTPGGQKACVHVHGSLPYLLTRPAPCMDDGEVVPERSGREWLRPAFEDASVLARRTSELLSQLTSRLCQALERNAKYAESQRVEQGRGGEKSEDPSRWKRRPLLYAVEVVERTPVYGFHPNPLPFLKISLFDPKHVRVLCSVLQSGAIQGVELQPYVSFITVITGRLIRSLKHDGARHT